MLCLILELYSCNTDYNSGETMIVQFTLNALTVAILDYVKLPVIL